MALTGDWGRFGTALSRLIRIRSSRAVARTGEQIAGDIAERARRKLGAYQDAVAQFPAWEALAEGTQAERTRLGYAPDEPLLRRGDAQGIRGAITTWPGSGPHEWMVGVVPGDPNAQAALSAETGASRGAWTEPQRAFLGPAVIEMGQDIKGYVGAMVETVIKGG